MAGPTYLSEANCLIHALADAAFTASPGSKTGWDPKLVKNGSPSLGWQASTALLTGNSPFFTIWDMGGAVTAPTFFAVFGLTLPTGATIDIVSDDAITLDSNAGAPQVIDNIANYADGDSHAFLSTLTASTKRYWGLRIVWGTDDGTPIVGECFLGNSTQLTRQCTYRRDHGRKMTTVQHQSAYGEIWAYAHNITGIDSYTLLFKDLSATERDEILAMHAASQGGAKVLAFIREPDSATAAIAKTIEPVRLSTALSWSDDLTYDFQAFTARVLPVQRIG